MGGTNDNDMNEVAVIDERLQNNSIKISKEDGLKPVSLNTLNTQTHSVGVIIPPPDVRAIVDKTAQFVAKNGPEFETRILSSEKNNQKFSFLRENSPFYSYYRGKIESNKLELKERRSRIRTRKGWKSRSKCKVRASLWLKVRLPGCHHRNRKF